VVLWAVIAVSGVGLGLWFRVPAIIAASGVTVIAFIALTPLTQLSLLAIVPLSFGLLTALQIGYLAGLALACALRRPRYS
jgi:hypothetical protein